MFEKVCFIQAFCHSFNSFLFGYVWILLDEFLCSQFFKKEENLNLFFFFLSFFRFDHHHHHHHLFSSSIHHRHIEICTIYCSIINFSRLQKQNRHFSFKNLLLFVNFSTYSIFFNRFAIWHHSLFRFVCIFDE